MREIREEQTGERKREGSAEWRSSRTTATATAAATATVLQSPHFSSAKLFYF